VGCGTCGAFLHTCGIFGIDVMKHIERIQLNYVFKEIKIVKVIIKLSYDNKCKETVTEIY